MSDNVLDILNNKKVAFMAIASKRRKFKISRDDLELSYIATPTFIWFIIFSYLPMFGVILAFKDYKPTKSNFITSLLESKWVGFDNFDFMFKTKDSMVFMRNTLLYNAVFIILGMIVAVTLAIMISELLSKRFAKVVQTSLFLPYFLSWVAVSYFVFSFLSFEKGLVNQIAALLGKKGTMFYFEQKYWPYILTFMSIWKGMGYGMVVYLATISGIDQSLYEAAVIDGAKKTQQIKYITIPMLKPIIIILLIMAVGRIFSTDFGLFFQVPRDSGPLYNMTLTIDVYVYKALMESGDIGYSSAAAIFQSICGLIMIVGANALTRKIDEENSLF